MKKATFKSLRALGTVFLIHMICMASSAWAGVTLHLPEGIMAVATNGKNTRTVDKADLPAGVNQIAVRFMGKLVSQPYNENKLRDSDVFVLKFTATGTPLLMQIPLIDSKSQLDRFNRKPNIQILDGKGRPVPLHMDKLAKGGLQIGRDYAEELISFNQTDSPAALKPSAGKTPAPAAVTALAVTTPPPAPAPSKTYDQKKVAEMLKFWSEQADQKTWKEFIEWAKRR